MFRTGCLLLITFAICSAANCSTFAVTLYSQSFSTPVVGTGTFAFAPNLGDGTYDSSSLSSYSLTFDVQGTSFTNSDLRYLPAPCGTVGSFQFTIYDGGSQFYFSGNGGCGLGSITFERGNALLTFEPSGIGPPPPDLYITNVVSGTDQSGVYSTTVATPEPGTAALMVLLAIGFLGDNLRRAICWTKWRQRGSRCS
jgi:hypothetical protein